VLIIVCRRDCILKIALSNSPTMKKPKSLLVIFGNNVRRFRKANELSQEELAYEAGLHRTYIGMIERAEKNITLLNIQKIADALEVDIINLFEDGE
jgi:DNA-binding XRE family transcriptional regulator